MAKFEDISTDQTYQGLVHQVLKSKQEFYIYGITVDPNYKKKVDYYVIIKPPGIGGREVLSEETLPKGTLMRIEKVTRCTNCLLDHYINLVVSFLNDNQYGDIPVKLRHLGTDEVLEIRNSVASVKPNLFETLPSELE